MKPEYALILKCDHDLKTSSEFFVPYGIVSTDYFQWLVFLNFFIFSYSININKG